MPLKRDEVNRSVTRSSKPFVAGRDGSANVQYAPKRASTPVRQLNEARQRRDVVEHVESTDSISMSNGGYDASRRDLNSLKFDLNEDTGLVPTNLHRAASSTIAMPEKTVPSQFNLSSAQRHTEKQDKGSLYPFTASRSGAIANIGSKKAQISTFDDTESFNFDDDSQGVDDQTMVFRGEAFRNARLAHPQGQAHATNAVDDDAAQIDRLLGANWRSEVAAEKRFQENSIGPDIILDGARLDQDSLDIDSEDHDEQDIEQATQDTPSRSKIGSTHFTPSMPGLVKNVTFAESPALRSRDLARQIESESNSQQFQGTKSVLVPSHSISRAAKQPLPMSEPYRTKTVAQRAKADNVTLKETANVSQPVNLVLEPPRWSDSTESSDDEAPEESLKLANSKTRHHQKRKHEETLDYDDTTLRAMNFDQLNSEDFNLEPRSAEITLTASNNRQESNTSNASLSEQLNKLKDLDYDTQKAIFHQQTDEQWMETGHWFIQKLKQDVDRLTQARLERRKISMRYEHVVRKRHLEITQHVKWVDAELKDLKKGGVELIAGRRSG